MDFSENLQKRLYIVEWDVIIITLTNNKLIHIYLKDWRLNENKING